MMSTTEKAEPKGALADSLRFGCGAGLAIFVVGIISGIISVSAKRGEFGAPGIIGVAIALVAGSLAWRLMRSGAAAVQLPKSPRMRHSRIALYAALGISFAIGIGAGLTGELTGGGDVWTLLFSSAPINMPLAVCGIAGWLVAMAVSAYWHTTIDEIERVQYEFGASLGMYAYFIITPVWWLSWRAGMASEPDGLLIFWIVAIVWSLGWMWRRYR